MIAPPQKNKKKNCCVRLSFFQSLSNLTNFLERLTGRHKKKTPLLFFLKESVLRLALAAPVYHRTLVHHPNF